MRNPLFEKFCGELRGRYGVAPRIEYSRCSMEPGWNVKFRKAGRALCTLYPREGWFTAMVVIGRRELAETEALLERSHSGLREIFERTREVNGQRWLMIDLEDDGELCCDALRLIEIKSRC